MFEDGATLYEYIEPDPLNTLLSCESVDEVSLSIEEYDIQIHSDGIIEIES